MLDVPPDLPVIETPEASAGLDLTDGDVTANACVNATVGDAALDVGLHATTA